MERLWKKCHNGVDAGTTSPLNTEVSIHLQNCDEGEEDEDDDDYFSHSRIENFHQKWRQDCFLQLDLTVP